MYRKNFVRVISRNLSTSLKFHKDKLTNSLYIIQECTEHTFSPGTFAAAVLYSYLLYTQDRCKLQCMVLLGRKFHRAIINKQIKDHCDWDYTYNWNYAHYWRPQCLVVVVRYLNLSHFFSLVAFLNRKLNQCIRYEKALHKIMFSYLLSFFPYFLPFR